MPEPALDLARKAAAFLEEKGFEHARLEAELLLAAVLGLRRLDLYLQHDRPVGAAELERFRSHIRRRLRHEPIAYILGEAHFRQLVLSVDARVLIPRPETEILVGEVLRWAASGRAASLAAGTGRRALDVGTGSGAIAASLLVEGGFDRVVATDISAEALKVAAENAARAGVTERLELRQGALWEPLLPGERFHAVVSNPPYVGEAEESELAADVKEWEPREALFAGVDGLAVIRELVEGAGGYLHAGGLLALEVGSGQAHDVAERLRGHAVYRDVRVVDDLAGRPRIVLAEKVSVDGANDGQRS